MKLIVHDTPEATAIASANRIAELMEGGEDGFSLGLAGGSTPEATYRSLRGRGWNWGKVEAWLSDERWVPPDHERSNGRMAAETLLDHVDARFHRPRWSEFMEPRDAAAHYEATLRSVHHQHHPDLILLGLGEDGHTASLFPGTPALEEESRWFVANRVPQIDEVRLTATFPLLWSARVLMLLVVGERKAEAVAESMSGQTPAGRLNEGEAEVEWHLDASAASLLS
jgi:6-phosphogluconolactonase